MALVKAWRPDPVVVYADLLETLDAIDVPYREHTIRVGDQITITADALDRLLLSARDGVLLEERS